MSIFPADYQKSWTLANEIVKEGIGLHSGETAKVILMPTDLLGFYLAFSDKPSEYIKLEIDQVRNSPLCTTLELEGKRIATVEHLFAALIGCGLTNVLIIVSGNEIPLLDGSALDWVQAIQKVGLQCIKGSHKQNLELKKSLVIYQGESLIIAIPSDKTKIIATIDFPYKAIGQQTFTVDLSPETFINEIAPARTFGFVDQLNQLKEQGLIKGGELKNALVCDGDNWVNPPLRFPNEPVRHKMLDLIGDLALVGIPKAQILVYRGSHALHSKFALALKKECS